MNAAALVVTVDLGMHLRVEDFAASLAADHPYTGDHSVVSGIPIPRLKLILIQSFPFVVLHFVVGSVGKHFFSFRFWHKVGYRRSKQGIKGPRSHFCLR